MDEPPADRERPGSGEAGLETGLLGEKTANSRITREILGLLPCHFSLEMLGSGHSCKIHEQEETLMEKRTMGSFLAALRKANGLTQKELAEQLNVSDRSVSRWERDEGAPDLSLIPVIAEFFGITCDELLQGQRKAQDAQEEGNTLSPKGEKQREHLLNMGLAKYKNLSLISVGLILCGLVGALAANFAFLQGRVGFYIGLTFILGADVTQAAFVDHALLAVSDEEIAGDRRKSYRRSVYRRAAAVWAASILLIAVLLPLAAATLFDTGLQAGAFAAYGLACGGIALAAMALIFWCLYPWMVRRGVVELPEDKAQRHLALHRLQGKIALVLAAAILLILAVELGTARFWGVDYMALGQTFEDYDSFAAFMETPVEPSSRQHSGDMDIAPQHGLNDGGEGYESRIGNTVTWYDEQGLPIRGQLVDDQGNVLCDYKIHNKQILEIRTGESEELLPITVVTEEDYWGAFDRQERYLYAFAGAYALACVGAAAAYLILRKRGTNK